MKIRVLDVMESKNKFRVTRELFCALALLLAIPFAAHAQQYSGTITGTVTDPSGAAVAGSNLPPVNAGANASYAATTRHFGRYSLRHLSRANSDESVNTWQFHE